MNSLVKLLEEENNYRIYCDMDGVLVDFDKGYLKLTGKEVHHVSADDPKLFWEPIEKAGISFWASLRWLPDGKALWEYIKPYQPILLSAPSRAESSKIGKRVWVKRELPGTRLILAPAMYKQQYAKPDAILIDDREKNIQEWNQSGGIGILHTSTLTTIKELKQLGL